MQSRDDRLDAVLRAIADRTRRAMLAKLASGPAMISELAEPFDMSRIAVSKHLRVLEAARLVTRRVEGRVHLCKLNPKPLRDLEKWLIERREFWTGKLDALAKYADEEAGK